MLSYIKHLFSYVCNIMDFFCIRRFGRAMTQKIYLIDYERSSKEDESKFWKFTMMGNSDQSYNLFFSPEKISCDCIDFEQNLSRKSLCKHLFYVFGYVAKFTFHEIESNDFPSMRRKLFRLFDGLFDNRTIHNNDGNEDCAICLQTLSKNCHKCERCSQLIHLDCLRIWLRQNASCPFCRYQTYISPVQVPQLEFYVKPVDQPKPVFLDEEDDDEEGIMLTDYPIF